MKNMMKKGSILFAAIMSGMFLLSACNQGQNKEEVTEVKKDIYLELYSASDDR